MTNLATPSEDATRLLEAARGFVPRITELAPRMRAARRLDDQLVEDMHEAGLFSVLGPKRWGGTALQPSEATQIIETIAAADCSTAWVMSFYMAHNWIICKFPLEVQEQLYNDGRSAVLAAAVLFAPPTKARQVDGGCRVTGRWPYGSGAWHASHILLPAMVEEAAHWCLVPRKDLELVDDWYMEAMGATGSVTVVAQDVFVPDGWHVPVETLTQPAARPLHEDIIFRLPFSALAMIGMSLALGALDKAVELAREKLLTSLAQGVPRVQVPAARIRWAEAYERSRVMRLVRDEMADGAVERALAGVPPTLESEAQMQLHLYYYLHGIKDAVRLLLDGLGTSTYRADNPLYRISQDIGMIATHGRGGDSDLHADRLARWLLGLGLQPGDPGTRPTR